MTNDQLLILANAARKQLASAAPPGVTLDFSGLQVSRATDDDEAEDFWIFQIEGMATRNGQGIGRLTITNTLSASAYPDEMNYSDAVARLVADYEAHGSLAGQQ